MHRLRDMRYWMACFLVVSCGYSAAHQTKLSSSLLKLDGVTVSAEIELNVKDLAVALDGNLFTSDSQRDERAI